MLLSLTGASGAGKTKPAIMPHVDLGLFEIALHPSQVF